MKFIKLLSTGILMLTGLTALHAQQRTCDMQVTLVSPAESAVINAYASFNITVNIVNQGPADLMVGDTVYYNTPSMFAFATAPYVLQQAIPSGGNATVTLTTAVNINENTEDQTAPYCVKVLSNPNHTGSFIDTTVIDNNTDCNTVTIKAVGATGVEELSAARNNLKLFPNPANGMIMLAVEKNNITEATVLVRDIAGRELSRKVLGKLPASTENLQLDISGLLPGIYIAEVHSDKGRFSGRFVKQ
jgi:hypothetical protein